MSETKDDAQQLEDNFIAWVTMAAVFITAAAIIEGHKPHGKYYFLSFSSIGIILLIITSIDYIEDKKIILDKGQKVKKRLDYLLAVIIFVIILSVIISYQVIKKLIQPK